MFFKYFLTRPIPFFTDFQWKCSIFEVVLYKNILKFHRKIEIFGIWFFFSTTNSIKNRVCEYEALTYSSCREIVCTILLHRYLISCTLYLYMVDFAYPRLDFSRIFAIFPDFKAMYLHDYLFDFEKFTHKSTLRVEINRLRIVSRSIGKHKKYFSGVTFWKMSDFENHGYAPPH